MGLECSEMVNSEDLLAYYRKRVGTKRDIMFKGLIIINLSQETSAPGSATYWKAGMSRELRQGKR